MYSFTKFMPKRDLSSEVNSFPSVFSGGDAETEIFTIDSISSNSKHIKFNLNLGQYLVWGRINSGTVNTNSGSSAFIAILSSSIKVRSIKIYTLNFALTENTYAAACDMRDGNDKMMGVIGTNHHQNLFKGSLNTWSGVVGNLQIYKNAISGTTLLSFQKSGGSNKYYAHFSQQSGGDRQILINWRDSIESDSNALLLSKSGYDAYHTKIQINKDTYMWAGYIFMNTSNPCKCFP